MMASIALWALFAFAGVFALASITVSALLAFKLARAIIHELKETGQ